MRFQGATRNNICVQLGAGEGAWYTTHSNTESAVAPMSGGSLSMAPSAAITSSRDARKPGTGKCLKQESKA